MMKKNEVLETLENGGYISLSDIYRSASVYANDGTRLDSCRYDTAYKIGYSDGYDIEDSTAWSYTRYVRKAAQEVKDDEPAQEAAQNEEEKNNMTFMDDFAGNYVSACMAAQEEPDQDEQQPAETEQEKTDRENREHCKHIADELDAYVNGLVYECPECGEYIRVPDLDVLTTETEDGETLYHLPCGCTVDDEPEQRGLYDYLADVFDIEYRIEHSDRKTVRSVRVMVAFGGPNIYIDSASKAVELYWWTDRASYLISSDAADALDEWAQELWSCC